MTSLSIIVPLFNKEAFVRESVAALAEQLQSHDEIVVVDDCSTDASPAVVRSLGAPSVRLLRMPGNGGPASARNFGASHARGSHLLFFDADDLPAPRLLAELRHAIDAQPADGIWTFDLAFQAHGEDTTPPAPADDSFATTNVLERDAFVSSALAGKPLCTASSTCVRADVFAAHGGFMDGLRYCEDPELWARLSASYRIVKINRVLATYRDVPTSLSYGLRAHPGAVAPYVQTLLSLAEARGETYRRLAISMITRNAAFSVALGGERRELLCYLARVSHVLPPARALVLKLVALLPRFLVRAAFALRNARIRRRADALRQRSETAVA